MGRMRMGLRCLVLSLLLWSGANARSAAIAVVLSSPEGEEAAEQLAGQLTRPMVQHESGNARILSDLAVEARDWEEPLVVVLDVEQGTVSVIRTSDGTTASRSLESDAAGAPYVVALAAVELIELVESAPPARVAPSPNKPGEARDLDSFGADMALTAGVEQSVAFGGDVGLLQPTVGIDVQLSRAVSPIWYAVGLHGTGILGHRRSQVLLLPGGADVDGSVDYVRNELALRLAIAHRQAGGSAVAFTTLGLAWVDVTTEDRSGSTVSAISELKPSFALGGELRYTIAAGLAVALGTGVGILPSPSRYLASPRGAAQPIIAFEEGVVEFQGRMTLVWQSGP